MQTKRILIVFGLALMGIVLVLGLTQVLPPGIDWEETYRPAAKELLALRNPYNIQGFFNPIWALFPLLPFAILPVNIGRASVFLIGFLVYAYSALRLGAGRVALTAFLLSPIVMHGLLNANIDWMPLLGFVLPPQLGLFLVVIKPQVGSVVALFWLVEAWRSGGWFQVIKIFLPVSMIMLLTFLIFGFWPLSYTKTISFSWNASLWPMSIPIGLGLVAAAFRTRKIEFAMVAGPCISPYVIFHSWVGALAAILRLPIESVVTVIGLWILVLLKL